jgi:hypothetical protein
MKTKKLIVLLMLAVMIVLIPAFALNGCKIEKNNDAEDRKTNSEDDKTTLLQSPDTFREEDTTLSAEDFSIYIEDDVSDIGNIIGFFDDETGFLLNYPSDIISFSNNYFVNAADTGILLAIEIKKIDELFHDEPLGYDIETSIKDEATLKEGNYGEDIDFAYEPSKKVVQIKDIYAKEFMVFGRYEICDTVFERKLIFYNNGYQVIMTLAAQKDEVIKSMPEYFVYDSINCSEELVWQRNEGKNAQDDFYNAMNSGTVSKIIRNWLNSYSYIVENFQINQDLDLAGSEIVFSTAKDISSDKLLNYEIYNLYPQFLKIDKVSPEDIQTLNSEIKAITYSEKEQFKKYIEETTDPDSSYDRFYTNNYNGDYSFSLLDSRLISLIYAVYTYTGGAHGAYTELSFNYDTLDGKEIMLRDIFRPGFDYLNFISDFSINDLKKQMLEMGGSYDEDWLIEGAGPDEDNFRIYALSKDSLVIKFAEYQVAPYVFGTFNVKIPYANFLEEINPDSTFAKYLDL